MVIGEAGSGTLIINGVLMDGSGTLQNGILAIAGSNAAWRNTVSLTLDSDAVVTAQGVIATGGALTIGAGGVLFLDDTAQVQTSTIDLAGGELALDSFAGQAPLALSTAVLLAPNAANALYVAGGGVLINYGSFGALGTAAGSLTVFGGGTLELYRADQFAGLDVDASTVLLEGQGAGLVTGGAGAIRLDGGAALGVSDGSGSATVNAASGSDTVAVGAADTVMFGGLAPLTFITGNGGQLSNRWPVRRPMCWCRPALPPARWCS